METNLTACTTELDISTYLSLNLVIVISSTSRGLNGKFDYATLNLHFVQESGISSGNLIPPAHAPWFDLARSSVSDFGRPSAPTISNNNGFAAAGPSGWLRLDFQGGLQIMGSYKVAAHSDL